MRSIRLSLIVYFLLLLAGALGGIGALVYQTTERTLREKEETTRKLLLASYESRCRAARDECDAGILHRAQTLASLAQSQSSTTRFHELYALGVLGVAVQGHGHLFVPLWIAESADPRLTYRLRRSLQIQFAEEVLSQEDEAPEYFQVYGELGNPLQRSYSLPEHAFVLDTAVRDRLGLFEWHYDDAELKAGVPVRRVTLKSPVVRFRFQFNRPERRPETPGQPRTPPRPPPPPPSTSEPRLASFDRSSPAIFIQCACETGPRDQVLAGFQRELGDDLAALAAESRLTLAGLRQRLAWTGLLAFTAVVLGGCWLVRVGLSPLERLSDAVSRVSAKDFHLDVDESRLPRELQPIAGRLSQTLEQLKRAFAREKQAAADISHELRTPLAALLATIELALRKPRSAEEYRELLHDCLASGQQMNQLVERLLALARLDAGVDRLHVQELEAVELAEQCAALVRPLAETHGLELRVEGQPPLPLHADPAKIREVLINLLHNAIEYNRPGGSVAVSVARHNGTLRLEVRDTGIGIPAEARTHIFERFYRADPSRQADGLHAGLGLAISKSYVELMGGTIAVDSTEGQGSCFAVELPLGSATKPGA